MTPITGPLSVIISTLCANKYLAPPAAKRLKAEHSVIRYRSDHKSYFIHMASNHDSWSIFIAFFTPKIPPMRLEQFHLNIFQALLS